MTRGDFERFVVNPRGRPQIFVDPPWDIAACDCGDVNCRGWRLVHARTGSSQPVNEYNEYVPRLTASRATGLLRRRRPQRGETW